MMQSAMPAAILADAMAMVSNPEAQYLFTVMPATFSVPNPMSEINLPTFKPCSASGMALPTITSLMRSLSRLGSSAINDFITSAAKSSGRVKRN